MQVGETLEDPVGTDTKTLVFLTYVLSFDDLLHGEPMTIHLDAPEIVIGRTDGDRPVLEPPSALRLPGRATSATHAVIRMDASACTLRDAGSRNGTYVNGHRIQEQRLCDGDLIEVGHCLLSFRLVSEPRAAPLLQKGPPVLFGPTETRCPELVAIALDMMTIAPTSSSVLILGETGSGKEVAAHAMHETSKRKGPLRIVNCGALPENLVESVLFGHTRGAFTGATENRVGEIANADGGTLFLDEVANMNLAAQAKLLRVTQDGIVAPIGSASQRKVDVRWVSATNANLFDERVSFREDLRNRLAAHVIRLPALRQRREDLGILAAYLLRKAGAKRASITPAAGRLLFNSPLDGNVRELDAALNTAACLAGADPIDVRHLPEKIGKHGRPGPSAKTVNAPVVAPTPIVGSVRSGRKTRLDKAALEAALASEHGNVTQTATSLGVHAKQLYRWMDRLGIDRERFRD